MKFYKGEEVVIKKVRGFSTPSECVGKVGLVIDTRDKGCVVEFLTLRKDFFYFEELSTNNVNLKKIINNYGSN